MSDRRIWLVVALLSGSVVATSIVLTHWLNLHPCPLCIVQRLLFMLLVPLTLLAGLAALRTVGRAAGVMALATMITGIGVAAYHVWLQSQEEVSFACGVGLIDRFVDWLGQQVPALFLADGMCGDKQLVFLGLSLAGWSLITFAVLLVAGVFALRRKA